MADFDSINCSSQNVRTPLRDIASPGELDGSYYQAVYGGISAKDIDKTIYVLAVYESEGEICLSGVISYSIEHFCRSQINSATQNNALRKALSVYCYYAKLIFNVD